MDDRETISKTNGKHKKNLKKGVDKLEKVWYSNKAVAAVSTAAKSAKENLKKIWKKCLTTNLRCVKLIKLLRITNGSDVKKLFEKLRKKCLTNEMKFGILLKLRR